MWNIDFYETMDGEIPVAEFLDSLQAKHKAKALRQIDLLSDFGIGLKEPYAKHIGEGLWELRIKFASDISRVFYFIPGANKIILLHGFVKKTQKTPPAEIKTAIARMDDYRERCIK
ncbi:MAG: type II toxin-antitoxin system RelE/ParE family toxin [Oscillospiraceae bacterium]|nr:type II toxin-antitoxin system RelE/ParE family toxin [Oscillospiraceae bacterium]MDD4592881.1 type II toxin-antitoxin system RelE/ParE family toxin [Parabacteroides sp.]